MLYKRQERPGWDLLGAVDVKAKSKELGKEAGLKLLSVASEELNKLDNKDIVQQATPKKHGGKSWWTSPQLGSVPGWGVVTIGAGLVGGLGYAVKKIFF